MDQANRYASPNASLGIIYNRPCRSLRGFLQPARPNPADTSEREDAERDPHVVTSLLDILCFEGDRLSCRTAEPLANAFLQSISDGIGDQIANSQRPCSLVDKRFANIQATIRKYLTCADLTCDYADRRLRQINARELDDIVASWTRGKNAHDLAAELQGKRVAAFKSLNSIDLVSDDHLWQRGFYSYVADSKHQSMAIVGAPWHMSVTTPDDRSGRRASG